MNRLEVHIDSLVWCWVLILLVTLVATARAEEQQGRAIEFSSSKSGAAITNRTAANRQQLQEDMLEQQLRDRITKPFRPNQDSLDAVMPPPSQQRSLSLAEIKRIKEKINERNNWMFVNPDEIGKSPGGNNALDNSSSEETSLEKDSLTALKRFYEQKNPNQMRGTNGPGGGRSGGNLDTEEDGDGLSGKDSRKPGTRDGSSKNSAGDGTPKGWFSNPSSRELDAGDQSSGFPDAFSPAAFIPFERSAADVQRNEEFKKFLDSGSTANGLGSLGNSAPATALSSVLADNASAPTMNTTPGYKPNPITSLSPAASGPLSSTTPLLNPPPAPFHPLQFKPVLPPRRTF